MNLAQQFHLQIPIHWGRDKWLSFCRRRFKYILLHENDYNLIQIYPTLLLSLQFTINNSIEFSIYSSIEVGTIVCHFADHVWYAFSCMKMIIIGFKFTQSLFLGLHFTISNLIEFSIIQAEDWHETNRYLINVYQAVWRHMTSLCTMTIFVRQILNIIHHGNRHMVYFMDSFWNKNIGILLKI